MRTNFNATFYLLHVKVVNCFENFGCPTVEFSVADPGFLTRKRILTQRKDPGCCSFRISDPRGFFSVPDPEVKKARDPVSRSATLEEYFREKDTSAAAHLHKIPDQIKILSLSSCVVNGPYSGKRAFFQTSSAYVWGHHLARANLMYNIRAGDMFRVEVICAV